MEDKKEEEKILEHTKDIIEKEETSKISIKEGMASSVMSGTGESYITPFALAIGANNAQIGFLSSIPGILSPVSQVFGSRLMERFSRKRIITIFVSLQALIWLPILLLSLFFWRNIFMSYLPLILILFYSMYAIFGALAGPAWFSLMGDLIPEKIRGKYFSNRNKLCGTVALISMLTGAFILDFFKTRGLVLLGFSILFLIALIFRMISASLFKKHYYPKFKLEKGYYFSFFQFIKKARKNNFGKFAIYIALMNFATAVAGPFFAVYMLNDLHFSYTLFILTNVSASVATLLFLPILGRLSDKYGNRGLLKFGSILVPLVPTLWMLSKSPVYIILIPQVISGIGWAAFNFSASNFIYDSVSVQRRGICVAYLNVLVGIGVFAGASIGGLLAQYLPITFMNKLLFLFLISGILRFLVAFNISKIKEVRKVIKPKSTIFYFKQINPINAVHEFAQDMFRIVYNPNKKNKNNHIKSGKF